MKQIYPVNRGNQSVGGNKLQLFSGATESGTRHPFYRSVILAMSGSLLCVAAGENAVGQSAATAPQTPGQMLGETAASLQPAQQWPAQPPEAEVAPSLVSDLPATLFPPSSVNVNYDGAISVAPGPYADANSNPNELPAMPLQQPTIRENEISASGDFMYGIGTITVPIGYALRQNTSGFPVAAVSADRSTVYYGGTVSYSYGRSWYIDFSGENGRSTGSTSLSIPGLLGSVPASFNVNDTWYQIYLRYNLKNLLAGTRFQAYLRGGVRLVSATLTTVNSPFPNGQFAAGDFYSENDNTFDALGNIGFGLTYSLYSTFHLKVGLQLEGEGFGGNRSQDITETLPQSSKSGSTTIDDTVYGAIGRLTLHADYRLGHSGRWKLTGDVGMMTINSFVSYPDFGTKGENLYGPYAKIGASFVF